MGLDCAARHAGVTVTIILKRHMVSPVQCLYWDFTIAIGLIPNPGSARRDCCSLSWSGAWAL